MPAGKPLINAQPDWAAVACARDNFVALVLEQGLACYRDLPWRNIDDAYGVLVSEVMLQQTQVARVLDYWPRWMDRFPSVDALAAASTADVLEAWQGLGYNRRALALKRACDMCATERGGVLPATVEELVALPGVGPATAAGVMAFAHNKPAVYVETNVRTVFLHHLFPDEEGVSDKRIAPYVADVCPREDDAFGPRAWYYALLDYGAHLKTQVANPSRRSAHYARQSRFAGSHREKRSFILKCVLAVPEGVGEGEVFERLARFEQEAGRAPLERATFEALVDELIAEGFFLKDGSRLVP